MKRDRVLRALRSQPTDTTPIWLMRQAGRYLPGYRKLRGSHSILELASTPELAAEVTCEPLRLFDLDAGVIFADITLPFAGFGLEFRIDAGVGPVIPTPFRSSADLERLSAFDLGAVRCVGEAIRAFHRLESERPLIGFAGAPFTLAAYLVEGGASREYTATRRMLYAEPELFEQLLVRLTDVTIDYLRLQVGAGADAVQLFDTWAGWLPLGVFELAVRPHLQRILSEIRRLEVPMIYFSTSSAHLLPALGSLGADAIGVDWRLPLGTVRRAVPAGLALQGNLDPGALLGSPRRMRSEAAAVLAELPDRRGHVFNLGHGVLPETPPEAVADLVAFVHAAGTGGGSS